MFPVQIAMNAAIMKCGEVKDMKDATLYARAGIKDERFPIQLFKQESTSSAPVFFNHWHEQLEILFFISGNAIIECNSTLYEVSQGDLIIVNSNELHSGYNPGSCLAYYCFNIDPSLIHSSFVDTCEMKYIAPIERNMIMFKNKASSDAELLECIQHVILEYEKMETAYELMIKSYVYRLLAILIRNHVAKIVTKEEYEKNVNDLERLVKVFNYIEKNYTEKIPVEDLCSMTGLSSFYFCRLFKKVTGKTTHEYINTFRINKAENLLKNTGMNITEIAMATGFNDINYFSRMFKKYKKIAPTLVRKMIAAAK